MTPSDAEPPRTGRSVRAIRDAPRYARGGVMAAVEKLVPTISAMSAAIERARTLPEPLVQALADAGLYRIFLPRSLGGGESDPLSYFDVVEELARADSAVGWSVLISTSSMTGTVRALADDVLAPMFTSPRTTIMAGSAPPRGRARPVPGGYRLSGRWTQGSNILIAGWVHVGCHVWDGERPRLGSDGSPIYLQCTFAASDAEDRK